MGKAKKIKVSKNEKGSESLADQINQGNFAAPSGIESLSIVLFLTVILSSN